VLVNKGVGFIDTVTFWLLVQPFAVRVNVYTTFTAVTILFVIVSVIEFPGNNPLLLGIVNEVLGTIALAHAKLVPIVALVPTYENTELLQIAVGFNPLFRTGVGFTTIVKD